MELTEKEMAHDRRAEEMAADMKQNFGDFAEFVQTDLGHMKELEVVFDLITGGAHKFAGASLSALYDMWCDAKSFELTGTVSSNEERGLR